jgi:hypothetical protein
MGLPDDARRHMDAARFSLQAHMTERRCACCTARQEARRRAGDPPNAEPMFLFCVTVAGVDVFWCPECDRVRCRHCGQPTGVPFQPVPHLCTNCGKAL